MYPAGSASVTWTLVAALKPSALLSSSVKTTLLPTAGVMSSATLVSDRSTVATGTGVTSTGLSGGVVIEDLDGDGISLDPVAAPGEGFLDQVLKEALLSF